MNIDWRTQAPDDGIQSAFDYLSLRFDAATAERICKQFESATPVTRRAGDILRACQLEPLSAKDPGASRNRDRMNQGKSIDPVLVISYSHSADIADGYHRTSAAYSFDPRTEVVCLIATLDEDEPR